MSNSVLLHHGKLRMVLPSAAASTNLPAPEWFARLHARKLHAATDMRILTSGSPVVGYSKGKFMRPAQSLVLEKQYLATYSNALRIALRTEGRAGLSATQLHVEITAPACRKGQHSLSAQVTSDLADALPALIPLLPQRERMRISSVNRLDEKSACAMVAALKACPKLHTLELATGHAGKDVAPLLHAACQLKQLHTLLLDGQLNFRQNVKCMPESLRVLGCERLEGFSRDDDEEEDDEGDDASPTAPLPQQLQNIHTLTSPGASFWKGFSTASPSAAGSNAAGSGNGSSSDNSSSGRGNSSSTAAEQAATRKWQPHTMPCRIDIKDLIHLPAVTDMYNVEIMVRGLAHNPYQSKKLLESLLGVQLASCACGWALVIDVDVDRDCETYGYEEDCKEYFPLGGLTWDTMPPGGLPAVQNVVVRVSRCMEGYEAELPEWWQQTLAEVFDALEGMQQLLLEPAVSDTGSAPFLDVMKRLIPYMVSLADIATDRQSLMHGGAEDQQYEGYVSEWGSDAGCLHAIYLAADGHRPQHRPGQLVTADCAPVMTALHTLTSDCARLRDVPVRQKGSGVEQAVVWPPLRVHVAGVDGQVVDACNAQLAAAAKPHIMSAW